MEKPNYRLGKVGTILQATIIKSINLRRLTQNIEDKTFCFTNCRCDEECGNYKCDCNVECPCEDYVPCRHCKCDDHCTCDDHCSCDAEQEDEMWKYCSCNHDSGGSTCSRL